MRAVVSERALEPAVAALLEVRRVDRVVHVTERVDVPPADLDAHLVRQYVSPSPRSMVASVRRRMRRSCSTTTRAGRVSSSSTYARSRFSYCTVETLGHLRRAGPAGGHAQPVVDPARELPLDELRRPWARPDEAHLASEDVDELRQLVEVERLQDAAACPGEVRRVRLERAHVTLGLDEHALAERAQLEEVEGAAA